MSLEFRGAVWVAGEMMITIPVYEVVLRIKIISKH